MSHFAQIDDNNIIIQVIVAEQDFIDSGAVGDPSKWIQTSYNTHAGQHPEGRPLRKNFAGIGFSYDPIRDAFIPPNDLQSWILNEDTCQWEAPIPYPDDGKRYYWDEEQVNWIELVIEE
jgi:hypothetical protein